MHFVIHENQSLIPSTIIAPTSATINTGKGTPDAGQQVKRLLWSAFVIALEKAGHTSEFLALDSANPDDKPLLDVGVFWNGQKRRRGRVHQQYIEARLPTVCIEHGWLRRFEYYHFSLGGSFGPFAHFADELRRVVLNDVDPPGDAIHRLETIVGMKLGHIAVRPIDTEDDAPDSPNLEAPREGAVDSPDFERMTKAQLSDWIKANDSSFDQAALKDYQKSDLIEQARYFYSLTAGDGDSPAGDGDNGSEHIGEATGEIRAGIERLPDGTEYTLAADGYVLLCLQVAGDAQHGDYDYHAVEWANEILADLPYDLPVIIRTHPMAPTPTLAAFDIPTQLAGKVSLHRGREVPLKKALASAAYMVSYNSNTVNEALVCGVPCLVTGPHLAAIENVTVAGDMERLEVTLAMMNEGWRPDVDRVRRYLAWLCERQWTVLDLLSGRVIPQLLADLEK